MDAKLIKLLSAAALAVALSGCGDDEATPDTAGEVAASWREAGLEVSAFRQLPGHELGSGECAQGEVNKVEVTLCRYKSEQEAIAAQPAGLKVVGSTTGSSVPSGKFLLVVADRTKADPDGRSINQIIQTYRGRTALVPPDRGTITKAAEKK